MAAQSRYTVMVMLWDTSHILWMTGMSVAFIKEDNKNKNKIHKSAC